MRAIDYVKLSPARNLTGLVTSDVTPSDYKNLSNFLLQPGYIGAEQIGFVTYPAENGAVIRLNMPNGEFCGDGVLALAVAAHWLKVTDRLTFAVEASGVGSPLRADIEPLTDFSYYAQVEMPVEYTKKRLELPLEGGIVSGTLIELSGISHFVVHANDIGGSRERIIEAIKRLATVHRAQAYGVMTYEYREDKIRMIPCIYIPQTGKLMFESACGSGSIAMGIFLSHNRADATSAQIEQPGGELHIDVRVAPASDGDVTIEHIALGGIVDITGEGRVFVSEL